MSRALGGLAAVAGAGLLWATVAERQWFSLRRVDVPVLAPGAFPIRILHLSDLHILPRQHRKTRWVSELATLQPDLVINTGDSISSTDAIDTMTMAFGDLLDIPGAFVFGNNDFYRPVFKSPHRYFMPRQHETRTVDMPVAELGAAQTSRGWADVNNQRTTVSLRGQRVSLAGVGDPHTGRDHYEQICGVADPSAAVRIGVTHSPEPHVLDAFAADGYDLVLAGHTHGGQIRIPGFGALVTNSGIDRHRVSGLSTWPRPERARSGDSRPMYLNVSAGLGNSPYYPVRLACRPEATLLTLTPRRS